MIPEPVVTMRWLCGETSLALEVKGVQDIWDMQMHLRHFLLACGYSPISVDGIFKEQL